MRGLRATLAAFGVGVLVAATPLGASGAPAVVARSAALPIANCAAGQVVLTVTIAAHPFAPGQPVTYGVRLHNTGRTPCGIATAPLGAAAHRSLTVGVCGQVPVVIFGAHGGDVFPGRAVFGCPMIVGLWLPGRHVIATTATWDRTEYLDAGPRPQAAPPGTYHLVVDRVVRVPFTLAAGVPGTSGPARRPTLG